MPNKLAKQWLPPVLRRWGNRLLGASIVYRGPFKDWATASAATKGYDQQEILGRVSRATQRVLDGAAAFEQDGIAMFHAPPPSPALDGLLLAAALDGGRLSVLDFGGGLASHYLRWRPLLSVLPGLHWAVVEQAHYATEGRRLFAAQAAISFHDDIASVDANPNVIFASSVLQYLPEPYLTLQRLIDLAPRVIVLARTPYGKSDAVMIQSVPASIGRANYPLWVLSRDKVHTLLSDDYTLLDEFESEDQPLHSLATRATYQGSIWLRRE